MPKRSLLRLICAALCLAGAGTAEASSLHVLPRDADAPQVIRPDTPNAVVGVLLQNLRGQGRKITSFGHAFRKGEVPHGVSLTAMHNGRPIPTQLDAKAFYNDGSLKHGVLHVRNPDGVSEAQLVLMRTAETHQPPINLNGLARRYDVDIVFEFANGRKIINLKRTFAKELQRRAPLWFEGPLVSEIRLIEPIIPQMTLIADVRLQADGAVRTSLAVHNDTLFVNRNQDIPYRMQATMSGQPIASFSGTHFRYSNWRAVSWAGETPSRAHVVYDMPYMMAAGAVPPYDPTISLDGSFLRKLEQKAAAADHGPMGSGLISKAMPNTGGRWDIGVVPAWSVAWLRRQSPAMRAVMMAQAEAAGAVPWHFRDSQTGFAPSSDDHPRLWLDGRAKRPEFPHDAIVTKVNGWSLDNAHQPNLSYIPYLISGDHKLLDEIHAQLAFGLMNYDPRYRGDAAVNLTHDQIRGQAWINRNHAFASYITPDEHPLKPYITNKYRARMQWYLDYYRNHDNPDYRPSDPTFGWIMSGPRRTISPWEQDYFQMTLAQGALMQHAENRRVYQGVTSNFMLGRFLRTDFNPLWGVVYKFVMEDANKRILRTWPDVARATLNKGNLIKDPASPRIERHDNPGGYTASARASYAQAVSAFQDPLAAEAYAFLAAESEAMDSRMSGAPEWSLVPMFPDGSLLPIRNHRIGSNRDNSMKGGNDNELFAGRGGNDTIDGGAGNDILAGWDGDDTLNGGPGINYLAGGRGSDLIILAGGVDFAAGGPGPDGFQLTAPPKRSLSQVTDFNPREDGLLVPASIRGAIGFSAQSGGTVVTFRGQKLLFLRGVSPAQVQQRVQVVQ